MSQTPALIATLKKQLKAHGKTYADLAKVLDLSEASVKRLFSENNFTLQRLETACQLIGLQLDELVQFMRQEQPQLKQLTLKQEEEIASDLELLLVAVCVINGYTYFDLIEHYNLSESRCIQKLAKLDKLKIIELLPNNRIKCLVSANFRWLADGPIQRFFLEKVESSFFRSRFNRDDEQLIVLNGLISSQSNGEMQKKLRKIAREFNELMHSDAALPMCEKHGTTAVLALRHWQFDLFNQFVKSR